MTKEEALKKIEELKAFIEQEDQTTNNKRWTPEPGENYWLIDDTEVDYSYWNDDGVDSDRLDLGNVFKTKEEAEAEVKKMKLLNKIKDLTKGFEPNWRDEDERKYSIVYDYLRNTFRVLWTFDTHRPFGLPYFASKEDAQHVIDTLGDELLLFID